MQPSSTLTLVAPLPGIAAEIAALQPALHILRLPACYLDSDQRYRLFNEAILALFGKSAAELGGLTLAEVSGPHLYEFLRPFIARALSGEYVTFNRIWNMPDGKSRWMRISYFPHFGADGKVLGFMALVDDIHQLKQLELESVERESQLRLVTDNIRLPISRSDRDLRYLVVNKPACDWFGHHEKDIIGRHWAEIIGQDQFDAIRSHIARALAGELVSYERYASFAGHPPGWIRAFMIPDRDNAGSVIGLYVVIVDIDEDYRLRQSLAARERQVRLIADNIDIPVSYIGADLRFRFSNGPGNRWLRLSEDQVVGRHISEIFAPRVIDYVMPFLQRAFRGERVTYERHAEELDTGGKHWIRTTLLPDRQPDGEIAGIYTVVTDIDQDYQLREALRAKEKQLRMITDNVGAPITYIDAEMRFQFVNKPGLDWAHRTESEAVGHKVAEVIGAAGFEYIRPYLEQAFAGRHVTYERLADWPHTGPRWVRNHLFPDMRPDGVVVGVYTLLTDIQQDYELRRAVEIAEQQIRLFTENIPAALAYLDTERRYSFVNNAFLETCGLTREQVLGRTPAQVLGSDAAEFIRPFREKALGGESAVYERLVRLPDGEQRWYRVRQVPDRDENGAVRGLYVVGTDVHDMKLAQEALRNSEAELRLAMDSVPYPMAYIDRNLRYQFVNRALQESSGLPLDRLVGHELQEVFSDQRFEEVKPCWERALKGETVTIERALRSAEGDKWMVVRYTPRFGPGGEVVGFYSAATDIDGLKKTELALRHANWMLSSHFENTPLAVMEWNSGQHLVRWSPQAEKIFGWSQEELFDKVLGEWKLVYEDDEAAVRDVMERLLSGSVPRITSLNRNYRKDGRVIWCEWYNSSLVNERGEVVSILSLAQDVTSRVLAEERLQHLATHDALTGLPNRVMLQERLRQAVGRARRSGQRVCTLFIDLDRFKDVNDTLGHRIGDELLREMSIRLSRLVRETDLLVRLSGDEFMVVLEQVTDLDAPRMVAQKLLEEIREPSHIEGHEIYVSASVGISLFPDDGDDGEALMKNADLAMYRAKALGKNTYQMFAADMAQHGAELRLLENALRSAIARRELQLHFQPVIGMQNGGIVGAEALLRWNHPGRGLLLPGEFMHLAEESGLIHEIGNWVLDAALAQRRLWDLAGLPQIRLAINIAAGQFRAPHLAERISERIQASGCDPRGIELEVTETGMLRDPEGVGKTLAALRSFGVRVAIDDFGTGYSSLSHLKRFPIDTLKIDRTFVTDVETDSGDAAIVAAVIALGRALNLEVVAEGVENEAQRAILARHGCAAYQGFFVSNALPSDEFLEFYRRYSSPPAA